MTWMRSTLPRRSFVLPALRRASTNGAWNQSPSCVVAIVDGARRRGAVIGGDVLLRVAAVELRRRGVDRPPVTITSPGSMFESASSAAWIAAAFALYGDRRGRLAVEGQRERAGRRRLTRTVCVSSVFMSLCGEKPPELPPPDGVSSPVTSHRLLCLSKSMSPATWQHAPRLLETRRIFCSLPRSSVGFGARRRT